MTDPEWFTKISVLDPQKVGEGIGAYVRYSLHIETNNPAFNGTSFDVSRRFKEFHALYETLVDIYRSKGIHIPHPPQKSITANTRVMVQSKAVSDVLQIEQRRDALQRFINSLARHPVLGSDHNVVNFLTAMACNIKPRAALLKFSNNISSTFQKFVPETGEYDQWFEEKFQRILTLESNMNELLDSVCDLQTLREDLTGHYKKFSSSLTALQEAESNATISKAVYSISVMKEKAATVMGDQNINEIHEMVGSTKTVLGDLISVKHLLNEYTKSYNALKAMEKKLQNKKEQLIKLQAIENNPKCDPIKSEIEEYEKKVKQLSSNLDEFYDKMKSEVNYFEACRVKDTRASMLQYFKRWKNNTDQFIGLLEETLPACQAIN